MARKTLVWGIAFGWLGIAFWGCAADPPSEGPEPAPIDEAAEGQEEEVRARLRQLLLALNRGDLEASIELLGEDIVVLPTDRPELKGRDAVRAFLESALRERRLFLSFSTDALEVGEDSASLSGRYSAMLTRADSGESKAESGRAELDFERHADASPGSGKWRLSRVRWTPTEMVNP